MSSLKGFQTRGDEGEICLVARRFARFTGTMGALGALFACGGTQGAVPGAGDGGAVEAAAPLLADSEMAACAASQAFEFNPIASYEMTRASVASTFATYVSFDLTGQLFPQGGAIPATGLSAISCMTGYPPNPDKFPQLRCGVDGYGVHLRSSDLTGWGMNMAVDLRQNCVGAGPAASAGLNGACYVDGTGWDGVSFWALVASPSSGTTALFTVSDPLTAGVLGGTYPFNTLLCGNPACIPNHDAGMDCQSTSMPLCLCDPPGKALTLFGHWQFYRIPFGELRQKGYGRPDPTLDIAHILAFKLSFGKGPWDVWIDDISLYRPKKS